ncbi:MAG: hypothetical protein ABW185_05755 [Sedimenticola sp.]
MASSNFFSAPLPETKRIQLTNVLERKSHVFGSCLIWTADVTIDGYGFYRTVYNGRRHKIYVHRLAYFLHNPNKILSKHMHVSHVCHNKLCILVSHLSYEPQRINNNRQICKSDECCTGHFGYPRCILE